MPALGPSLVGSCGLIDETFILCLLLCKDKELEQDSLCVMFLYICKHVSIYK